MIAFATVLKLGAAGLGMALFLRKFRGETGRGHSSAVNKAVIVVLSTAYALGAWSLIYAFNIMWLDALYLLPWALLGVERLLAKGRIASLAIAIGLNLIIDFYTGAMICVFVCMYALARYFGVRERFERADFLRTAGRFAAGRGDRRPARRRVHPADLSRRPDARRPSSTPTPRWTRRSRCCRCSCGSSAAPWTPAR